MNFSKRLSILKFISYGFLVFLTLSLFQTQIIRGGYYRRASERNRIRLISVSALRGNILDRNGLLLATNRPAYHVYIIPEDFDPQDLPVLSRLLHMPENVIRESLRVPRYQTLAPALLKKDVSKEIAFKLEERKPGLAGVYIQVEGVRSYPAKDLNGHILGYIGKITKEEYQTRDQDAFSYNSYIGRMGVEKSFDSYLRGEEGGRQLEVNARGEQVSVLSEKKPTIGQDLTLSIDLALEKEIVPLLGDKKAAVALMDITTGEMLALLSQPDFDPNIFIQADHDEDRIKLLKDKTKPLINRATLGAYPPGSVFKLVTALAGLETGKITRYTTFDCAGFFRLNPHSRRFKCWEPLGHGRMDLLSALERSCNVYFYNVGRLVGEKDLSRYAKLLGLGEHLPFEVASADGLIPSAEWKEKHYAHHWFQGETVSFAIGQGYVLVTPLQILQLVATFATEGRVVKPTLIKRNPEEVAHEKHEFIANSESFRIIKQGMLKVVESKYGTGQLARIDFMRVAAKTGTAQAPPERAHAWFAGFFPYENPHYALVVFVEHGGSGGLAAATVAKNVLAVWRKFYGKDQAFQKPELPPVKLEDLLA